MLIIKNQGPPGETGGKGGKTGEEFSGCESLNMENFHAGELVIVGSFVAFSIAILILPRFMKKKAGHPADREAPGYKGMVLLSVFMAPLWGGAIIYYALRNSHEALAKYSNRMSFLAFLVWIGTSVGLGRAGLSESFVGFLSFFFFTIVGISGVVLSIITVRKIKKASGE